MGATVADMEGFNQPSQEEIEEQVKAVLETHEFAKAMVLERVFKKRFPDTPYLPDIITERGEMLEVEGKMIYYFDKEPLVMFNTPEIVGEVFGQKYLVLNPENETHKKLIVELKKLLERTTCNTAVTGVVEG